MRTPTDIAEINAVNGLQPKSIAAIKNVRSARDHRAMIHRLKLWTIKQE